MSKVLDGVSIREQALAILNGTEIPKLLRAPDVRVIANNTGTYAVHFFDPGNFGSNAQHIPSRGDETAAMIMPAGSTIREQYKNAQLIIQQLNDGGAGALARLLNAAGSAGVPTIKQAYGKAPYGGQVGRLKDFNWEDETGTLSIPTEDFGHAAIGVRPPESQEVILVRVPAKSSVPSLKGGFSQPENLVDLNDGTKGIYLLSYKHTSGEMDIMPIVPSEAAEYYGAGLKTATVVDVDEEGNVTKVTIPSREPPPAAPAPAV